MSDKVSQLYEKREYFVNCAKDIVRKSIDAEDAVHNAFVQIVANNGSARPTVASMEKLVRVQCYKLVERRDRRNSNLVELPEDTDEPDVQED